MSAAVKPRTRQPRPPDPQPPRGSAGRGLHPGRLDPAGATLVKFTNNAVLRLARDTVVARIAGSDAARRRVPKIIAVANWLASQGMPSVRDRSDVQPEP